VQLDGLGNASEPQLLEVMGQDLGNVPVGFIHNFAYSNLSLANNTYLRLVDNSDNAPGTGNEALYVDSLIVACGLHSRPKWFSPVRPRDADQRHCPGRLYQPAARWWADPAEYLHPRTDLRGRRSG